MSSDGTVRNSSKGGVGESASGKRGGDGGGGGGKGGQEGGEGSLLYHYTNLDDIPQAVSRARKVFNSGVTYAFENRRKQLRKIRALLVENVEAFVRALTLDLHRPPTLTRRIHGGCIHACDLALKRMEDWGASETVSQIRPKPKSVAEVRMTPRGTVCVIGTWNFPLPLHLKPLISALAAGNTVVLKLNEGSIVDASFLFSILNPAPHKIFILLCTSPPILFYLRCHH